MQVDKPDPIILDATIPIISASPVRILVDKCESADLFIGNTHVETILPGELVTTPFFARWRLPFMGNEAFVPQPDTHVRILYDAADYPHGKYPSITITN